MIKDYLINRINEIKDENRLDILRAIFENWTLLDIKIRAFEREVLKQEKGSKVENKDKLIHYDFKQKKIV